MQPIRSVYSCSNVIHQCTVVQSSHFIQASLGRKNALPSWLVIRATYSCRQFPRRGAFLSSLSYSKTTEHSIDQESAMLSWMDEEDDMLGLKVDTRPYKNGTVQLM